MNSHSRRATVTALLGCLGLTLAACGGGSSDGADAKTVTLVTHDAFAASKPVLRDFTKETGYRVRVLRGGDAGAAVNQAILAKEHPQGDVFFGVDNTLLSRALGAHLFTPYRARGLDHVPAALQLDRAHHRVTPVDYGDICVNYDRGYFARHHLAPPKTLADLVKPAYKNLLVTENAATSSPGLGFLLATAARYGDHGWPGYWKKLRANGVEVVDSWEQAYNDRFSGSAAGKGKGDKPLVVSYASSPPAEVVDARPRPRQAPTGVATGTCFRQVEFAGLLHGARNTKGGRALLDFMLSRTFQQDVPLEMYVNPARKDARLPEVFTRYEAKVAHPITMDPKKIAKNREPWVRSWSSQVLK